MNPDIEGGPGDRPALARCIRVPVDVFAADYWGQAALLSPASDLAEVFDDLFSSDAVDELLADRGLRTPFIRMAKEGVVLPPSRYTASGGFGAEIGDQVSSEKVLAEFAAGATIVLQGLHRTWQPLREFTRQLIDDLGHPVQINAYITPASSRGFDPHYDVHDVFVLQITGEKRWVVHPPVHEAPFADEPWSQHAAAVGRRATEAPVIDTVLSPGDSLYLPRGWIHSATAQGGTTVHVTVGMPAFTHADLAKEIVARALRSDALRVALPVGIDLGDAAGMLVHTAATLKALADALETDAGTAPAADLARRFAGMVRAEPVHPLAMVDRIAALDADDMIRRRNGVPMRIGVDSRGVALRLADRTIRLPAECEAAATALLRGDVLPAGRLPGLDVADSLVVVRRLLREAVVVPSP